MPRNIVIYRSGTTGLDMKRIKDEEIGDILKFLHSKVGEETQLLYIMVHKDHAVRFFKKERLVELERAVTCLNFLG